MSKNNNLVSSDSVKRIDATATVRPDKFVLQEIDRTGGKTVGVDYTSELARLAETARKQSSETVVGLVEERGVFQGPVVSETFGGIKTPTAQKMDQAKALMAKRQWKEALQILTDLLNANPAHQDAMLYAASCEHELKQHLQALKRLYQLRTLKPTPAMHTRIKQMREKIRDVMSPSVIERCNAQAAEGKVDEVITSLQSLLQLDPEAAMYHYMLAMFLVTKGDTDAASKAIETALAVARPHEKPQLLKLRNDINDRIAMGKMTPAIGLFKQRRYREARQFLASLADEIRHAPLCGLFDRFLGQCEAGNPHAPASTDFQQCEQLYEFVLAEELMMIRLSFAAPGMAGEGERLAAAAVGWLPQYPYIHFLYGSAIYYRLGDQFAYGQIPTLEELLTDLRIAASHAQQAKEDSTITAAANLHQALQDLITQFEEIEKEIAAQQREAGIVNPLIDTFTGIMQSASGGIRTAADIAHYQTQLTALKKRIGQARSSVTSASSKDLLTELATVIDRNLGQLIEIEAEFAEASILEEVILPFNNLMDQLDRSGVNSPHDLQDIIRQLNDIKGRIPRVRARVSAPISHESLNNLERAVDDNLRNATQAQAANADWGIAGPIIDSFNSLMKTLEHGSGFTSQYELENFRDTLRGIRDRCQNALFQVYAAEPKRVLNEVITAIDQML